MAGFLEASRAIGSRSDAFSEKPHHFAAY